MNSEGLCDTEDWSNDAENSALHQAYIIWKCKEIENIYLNCNTISQYYNLYCITVFFIK